MKEETTSSSATSAGRRTVLKGFVGAAALATILCVRATGQRSTDTVKLVADGKLPALAQRVACVTPRGSGRKSRGVRRRTAARSARQCRPQRYSADGRQPGLRAELAFTEVLPGVAEKWDVNATSTEFTFTCARA